MKKLISIFLCVIIMFSFVGCKKKEDDKPDIGDKDEIEFYDIVLAEDGKSDYTIVIPEEASEETEFAAEEFKQFFYEITGAVLPIKPDTGLSYSADSKYISLGLTEVASAAKVVLDKNKVTQEGFYNVTKDKSAFIIGGGDNGQMYGVYDFLERAYGLKFYADDEIYAPEKGVAYLPKMDYVENPTLQIRSIGSYEFNNNQTWRRRTRTHLRSEGWIYTSHSFFHIMPPDKYYNEHKDWYSQDKTQLCLTNEEMTVEFINNLYALYTSPKYAEAVNCMLGIEDKNTFCTCEKCLHDTELYKESGIMVRFCNKVYEGLRKKLDENGQQSREVRLFMYAYMKTISAPVDNAGNPLDPSVIPNDHVGLMIAPLSAKYDYALNHEVNIDTYSQIEGWKKVFKENIYMYIYGANYGIYSLIVNDFGSMKENVTYFKDFNSIGVFWLDAHNRVSANLSALKNYMQSQLLWDATQDPTELMTDFCQHYYRDAADAILKYIDLFRMQYLENELKFGMHCVVNTSAGQKWIDRKYWPIDFFYACDELFEEAYAAIEHYKDTDTALYNKLANRLKLQSLSHRLLKLELYGSLLPVSVVTAEIDSFEADCADMGMTESGENSTTSPPIADYIKKWRLAVLERV